MSGHCKDCKHWGDEKVIGSHACMRITPESGEPWISGDNELGAFPPELITPPTFGCVLFEAKVPA